MCERVSECVCLCVRACVCVCVCVGVCFVGIFCKKSSSDHRPLQAVCDVTGPEVVH